MDSSDGSSPIERVRAGPLSTENSSTLPPKREYRVSIWQTRRSEACGGSKHPRSSDLTMQPCLRVKSAMTTYQQVGGLKTFRRLARDFYARVTRDPLLRRLFSKKTDKQRERLALFLAETCCSTGVRRSSAS